MLRPPHSFPTHLQRLVKVLEEEVKVALFQPALPDGPCVCLFQILRIFGLHEGKTRRRRSFVWGLKDKTQPDAVTGLESCLDGGAASVWPWPGVIKGVRNSPGAPQRPLKTLRSQPVKGHRPET